MIKIENVEIKQTKKGTDYKQITLKEGTKINMWSDDVDYNNAEAGVDLDREIKQEGKFWNLVSLTGNVTPKKPQTDDINKKLDAIYWVLQEIAKAQGITPKVEDESAIDPETNINTEDIPF